METQPQNNNSNYLIHPKFKNVYRLFVLSFTSNNVDDNRDSFSDYYVSKVEIEDFNILIDGKSFFDLPVNNLDDDKRDSFSRYYLPNVEIKNFNS